MNLPPPPRGYTARMPRQEVARRLRPAGRDTSGRLVRLTPAAARAWQRMQLAARKAGLRLQVISSFRSVARQAALVRAKLRAGESLRRILRVSAYPGHSEHHTGRALDLGAPRGRGLDAAFERTPEFAWLRRHARQFGFGLSYPRGNAHGIAYEPWHWCYRLRPRPRR
jgi:D-alanyl-D-alanine carboxypeptidase